MNLVQQVHVQEGSWAALNLGTCDPRSGPVPWQASVWFPYATTLGWWCTLLTEVFTQYRVWGGSCSGDFQMVRVAM